VIGVIDLLAARAVHARAGARDRYAPLTAVAGVPIEPGNALAVAREYVNRLGLTELYVADLDAILDRLRGQPDASASLAEARSDDDAGPKAARRPQDTVVAAVAALGVPLWLDAGVSSVDDARHAFGLGAAHVIVGLETLPSYDALAAICAALDGERVAFSLDLRDGEPILMDAGAVPGEPAQQIARRAADAGARAVIVIDLARVGTGQLVDLGLIARVRRAAPDVTLVAGGGVRGLEDVRRLADSGCDGVLVATALHDGRLGAADVAAAQQIGRPGQGSATR
jgi:phosphoribosylformimino-5-aminoimidazole carboxamide ribotide isomerase